MCVCVCVCVCVVSSMRTCVFVLKTYLGLNAMARYTDGVTPKLIFQLTNEHVRVLNNETGFTRENVDALVR